MTRQWLAAALVAGLPWSGCDREPITPPATPPTERAPLDSAQPGGETAPSGTLLIDLRRRLG
jgi:hypothetical protein